MAAPDFVTSEDFHNVVQVFNALAITDLVAHNSAVADARGYKSRAVVVVSTLNQSVSIQVQVSSDGVNFASVGSAQTVAASANAAFGSDVIAALGQPYSYVRLVATGVTTAATSGTLSANIELAIE